MNRETAGMRLNACVEDDVVGAIAATCRVDPTQVQSAADLTDLGLDSLGLFAVIARLEARYQIELAPDQLVTLLQAALVGEFTTLIADLIRAKRAKEAEDQRFK